MGEGGGLAGEEGKVFPLGQRGEEANVIGGEGKGARDYEKVHARLLLTKAICIEEKKKGEENELTKEKGGGDSCNAIKRSVKWDFVFKGRSRKIPEGGGEREG